MSESGGGRRREQRGHELLAFCGGDDLAAACGGKASSLKRAWRVFGNVQFQAQLHRLVLARSHPRATQTAHHFTAPRRLSPLPGPARGAMEAAEPIIRRVQANFPVWSGARPSKGVPPPPPPQPTMEGRLSVAPQVSQAPSLLHHPAAGCHQRGGAQDHRRGGDALPQGRLPQRGAAASGPGRPRSPLSAAVKRMMRRLSASRRPSVTCFAGGGHRAPGGRDPQPAGGAHRRLGPRRAPGRQGARGWLGGGGGGWAPTGCSRARAIPVPVTTALPSFHTSLRPVLNRRPSNRRPCPAHRTPPQKSLFTNDDWSRISLYVAFMAREDEKRAAAAARRQKKEARAAGFAAGLSVWLGSDAHRCRNSGGMLP